MICRDKRNTPWPREAWAVTVPLVQDQANNTVHGNDSASPKDPPQGGQSALKTRLAFPAVPGGRRDGEFSLALSGIPGPDRRVAGQANHRVPPPHGSVNLPARAIKERIVQGDRNGPRRPAKDCKTLNDHSLPCRCKSRTVHTNLPESDVPLPSWAGRSYSCSPSSSPQNTAKVHTYTLPSKKGENSCGPIYEQL